MLSKSTPTPGGVEPFLSKSTADRPPGVSFALGAFEAFGGVVFFCWSNGEMYACTRQAAAELERGEWLVASGGELCAASRDSRADLRRAIAAAGEPVTEAGASEAATPVVFMLHHATGQAMRRVEISRIGPSPLSTRPSVLVRLERMLTGAMELLLSAGLTPAEAEVAELAGRGLSAAQIARTREVGRPTVRAQLAATYAKLGVSSRVELSNLLHGRGIGMRR